MPSLKSKVITGVMWRVSEQFGSQLISFAVSVVLARVLGPDEFGTVALLAIFLSLSLCLVNSGFGVALIQKRDADDLDFNSVFYLSVAISLLLYAVLWCCAPVVAGFYERPILVPLLRVLAIKLIFDGLSGVQNAVLARNMLFRRSFWITLSGTSVSGIIGIWMAYAGFGIWALVWSSLAGSLVSTTVRWFLIGWRPACQFSIHRLKGMFGFGSRMLAVTLIDTFFTQVYGLLIGKWYSASDLAYFNRGDHLPQMAMNSIQGSIGSVVFPALTQLQHDREKLRAALRRVMQTSSFFVFPLMFGLAAVAGPLISILLTDKWLPCVPYMQLACISYALWPIQVANLQAIQALGRSDLFLKLEVVKKATICVMLVVTFRYGVLAMAIGRVALAPLHVWINSLPNKRLIGYSLADQFKDLAASGLLSLAMALSAWSLTFILHYPWEQLIGGILVGVVVYALGAVFIRLPPAVAFMQKLRTWL